jgi:hypothetical protein
VPAPGETECGDAWSEEQGPGNATVLVVDGLGHGPDAAVAAREAVRIFGESSGALPVPRVEALNAALRATRGAAIGVAHIDAARKLVRFSGLGNISDPCTTTIRFGTWCLSTASPARICGGSRNTRTPGPSRRCS